jgi:hypothetical protein
VGWCQREGSAGALVATVGPASAGTQATRLLYGFVEKDIGFGHGVVASTTFIASMRRHSQVKTHGSVSCSLLLVTVHESDAAASTSIVQPLG